MTRLLVGLLALLVATSATGQPMSLDIIARDPIKFDHRPVILSGTVGLVDSRGDRPAFQLIDGAHTIRVVAPPQLPTVRPGDRVEVEGVFNFAGNQIDANRVTWR